MQKVRAFVSKRVLMSSSKFVKLFEFRHISIVGLQAEKKD